MLWRLGKKMIMLKVTFKLKFDYFFKKVVVNLFPLKKKKEILEFIKDKNDLHLNKTLNVWGC